MLMSTNHVMTCTQYTKIQKRLNRLNIISWTGQSQELCVKDRQLKYQLDPTVNEVGTFIL